MPTDKVKKIVKAYAEELRRRDFPFTKIFLYGSYAKGRAHEWSDIDVCVVSPKFHGKQWNSYEQKLWQWRRNIDPRIEPIGFSPEDLTSWSPLAHEIRKYGIKIA